MLIAVAEPPRTSRVTSAGVGDRLVGEERDVELLHQPAPAEHVVGRAQLLGERQVEVGHLASCARADSAAVQPRLPSM